MTEKDQNVVWIRAVACIMVVVVHVAEIAYRVQATNLAKMATLVEGFTRSAVPLFAMISGYLLFNSKEEPLLKLVGKRAWVIFKIIAYFGTIYYLWDTIHHQGNYPYYEVFFYKKNAYHLWYLHAILPVYVISAYITLPQRKSKSFYYSMLGVIILAACLLNLHIPNLDSKSAILLFYMMIGFSLKQIVVVNSFMAGFFGFLYFSIVIMAGITTGLLRRFSDIGTPKLIIQSFCFFIFINSLDFSKILSTKIGQHLNKTLSFMAKYSIGIYGWHVIFINLSYSFWQSFPLRGFAVLALTAILTFNLSLLAAIIDTWFWKKFRQLFQPLGERFLGLVKSIKMGYNISK